jgi:hypothetical protein
MIRDRTWMRAVLYLGSIGLAAMTPPRGLYPTWIIVGLIVVPIALLELGDAILEDARSLRTARVAQLVSIAGALAYPFVYGLYASMGTDHPSARTVGLALGSIGFLPALLRLRETDDRAGPIIRGRIAVIGGMPIVVGLICLGFVIAGLSVLVFRPRAGDRIELWIGVLFFGSGFAIAWVQGLERWRTLARGRAPGLALIRFLALAGFTISLLLFGLMWPGISGLMRVLFTGAGVLFAVGTIVIALRGLGLGPRWRIDLAREGLLERTRRFAILTPWDQIAGASIGELQGNLALFVALVDVGGIPPTPRVLWSRGDPDRLAKKRIRSLARSSAWFGAHWIALEISIDRPISELYDGIATVLAEPGAAARWPPAEELLASDTAPHSL